MQSKHIFVMAITLTLPFFAANDALAQRIEHEPAPSLFDGVKPTSPGAGQFFLLANARGVPVLTLTERVREGDGFKPLKPTLETPSGKIELRLLESTTQNKPMGVVLGKEIRCGEQTCWTVDFATNGEDADYALMLLDRDVPLTAGETMHGCYNDPPTDKLSSNRPIWAALNSGSDTMLPRIVLRPIENEPGHFQLRAIEKEPDAQGVYKFRDELLLNTGTPTLFDDHFITKTDYTCTWRTVTQTYLDGEAAEAERFPNSAELAASVKDYKEDTTFQLYASNGKFCQNYKQFDSNAGQCATCSVAFEQAPDGKIAVTSNNGWSADVTQATDQGTALATGSGKWSDTVGGPYSGLPFTVSFEDAHDVMTMQMKTELGVVAARFRCVR